jgi:hypothetical protein
LLPTLPRSNSNTSADLSLPSSLPSTRVMGCFVAQLK